MALEISDRDGVRTITLNRPEALNAFNGEQFDDLTEAFLAAATDPACRAVVLTGRGRAFSAGADLMEMSGGGSPATHGFGGFLEAVLDFDKPFLLAINGLGVGIGATITGLADFVYMASSARLKCPFSELGLVAEAGSTRTFPALMGRQKRCGSSGLGVYGIRRSASEGPGAGPPGRRPARRGTGQGGPIFAAFPSNPLAGAKRLVAARQGRPALGHRCRERGPLRARRRRCQTARRCRLPRERKPLFRM